MIWTLRDGEKKRFEFKWDFHLDLKCCQKGTKTDKTSESTLLNVNSEVYPQSSMPESDSVSVKFNAILLENFDQSQYCRSPFKYAKFTWSFLKHWRQIQVLLRKLIWLHKSFSTNQSQFRKTENLSLFPSHAMSESISKISLFHTFYLTISKKISNSYFLSHHSHLKIFLIISHPRQKMWHVVVETPDQRYFDIKQGWTLIEREISYMKKDIKKEIPKDWYQKGAISKILKGRYLKERYQKLIPKERYHREVWKEKYQNRQI